MNPKTSVHIYKDNVRKVLMKKVRTNEKTSVECFVITSVRCSWKRSVRSKRWSVPLVNPGDQPLYMTSRSNTQWMFFCRYLTDVYWRHLTDVIDDIVRTLSGSALRTFVVHAPRTFVVHTSRTFVVHTSRTFTDINRLRRTDVNF